ncbi:MAG: hypothetical protein GEV13_22515 [Rhodospirillales bacterium]|nr:hypothetical protein [Rhodospirillales bacterium]
MRRLLISATPSRADWGFPGVFKLRTGKELTEVTDGDLSTIDEIAAAIRLDRERGYTKMERQFLLRTNRNIVLVVWRPIGQLQVLYPIADGIVGSLTVIDPYLDRLPLLIKVAQNFWQPC